MAYFIAKIKIGTERTANFFVKDDLEFHGLLESIVSDRGKQFVSGFGTTISQILGIRL